MFQHREIKSWLNNFQNHIFEFHVSPVDPPRNDLHKSLRDVIETHRRKMQVKYSSATVCLPSRANKKIKSDVCIRNHLMEGFI